MAQSLNTKLDLTTRGTMFMGLSKYGDVMIGDKAFEFYNERNPEDYIQIPWQEIDHISAASCSEGVSYRALPSSPSKTARSRFPRGEISRPFAQSANTSLPTACFVLPRSSAS